VERTLALICGAGPLPARMAALARREGWRVVAFTFGAAEGLADCTDRVVPSRVTELGPLLLELRQERAEAALFAGKLWMGELLSLERHQADAVSASFERAAESRSDTDLSRVALATLGSLGIDVLDQRRFMGDWLAAAGCLTSGALTEDEWRDVRTGLEAARALAAHRVGQTVVVRHGVVTAVEAVEGTTATIERGTALAGRGAIVVKAVAAVHDYRFDLPAVGPDTIDAAARGGARVLAIQAERVALLEREQALARAERAGLALVGVDDSWPPPS
jgi:UDP-2,3-diacylglucosamine hydrolase